MSRSDGGGAPRWSGSRHETLSTRFDAYLPYLMLAPAFLLAVGLLVYPVAWAARLSLYEVPVYAPGSGSYVGLEHYVDFLMNPLFYRVMWNTVVFVGASVVGQFGLGLGLALLLHQEWLGDRLARVFRASFILPWATSGVIVAYSWQFMFDPRLGFVNAVLRAVGVASPPGWLHSIEWAMIALVVANVWRGAPFSLIFQTSALRSVQSNAYDAAAVAGASRLQTVRHVTLPQLRPFLLMNLVLITLFTVNVFDIIFVMTGGGPLESTEVLSLHMYEAAFEIGHLGRASALAVVLFAVNLLAVGAYLSLRERSGVFR